MPSSTIQSQLEWDVYHIIQKLNDQQEDVDVSLTLYSVSDYIRRSNSSLARVKKKPLETAIDKALKFWRDQQVKEGMGGKDEDTDMDDGEPAAAPGPKKDSNLLNRQLVKRWNVAKVSGDTNGTPKTEKLLPAKKRKPTRSPDRSGGGGPSEPDSRQSVAGRKNEGPEARKKARPRGYTVEEGPDMPLLGGIGDIITDMDIRFSAFTDPENELAHPQDCRSNVVVLSGPMGCGKRSIVKFLARRWKVPLVTICCQTVAKEDKADRVFQEAREEAQSLGSCVIHLDHYEALWSLGESHQNAQPLSDPALFGLFAGLKADRHAEPPRHTAVIATTRKPEAVPGYFLSSHLGPRHYPLKIPNERSRAEILRALAPDYSISPDFDFAALAKATHGYLPGDFRHLLMDLQVICRSQKRLLTTDAFKTAMKQYLPVLYQEGFSPVPEVTLDSVGGLAEAVELLSDTILFPIQHPDLEINKGRKADGILLWGPPGCGKTYVAQAIANAAQAAFILVNGPELLDKYVGESERKIRALFERARSCAPCLIFFDEFDSIAPNRSSASTEASTRVVNTLLAEMDGAKKRTGVFLIAATNRPDMLDPALLRPGRFSREVYVGLPNEEERVDIIRKTTRDQISHCTAADLDVAATIARHRDCDGFSGADLAQLCSRARLMALKASEVSDIPRQEHWLKALAQEAPSVVDIEIYEMMRQNRKRRR
jgi:ribosome biogenesis ATPase